VESSPSTSYGLTLSRSLLFVPGDDERKISKARELGAADALIIDLEDAVAVSRKDDARRALADTVRSLAHDRPVLVRVNALDTGRGEADIDAAVAAGAHGIVAPKVGGGADLERFDAMLSDADDVVLVPLVETASALVHLSDVAGASPRVALLALGAGDLVADLGLPATAHDDDGGVIDHARMMLVLHSRSAGLRAPLDSPELNVRDMARFRRRCEHARRRGFGGILCIHPSQVEVANEVFAPTPDELERARSIVEAFDRQERAGSASITLDGVFVDYPIAEAARRVLRTNDLIAQHAGARAAPQTSTGGPS
jgi:citrate lyase subunit beta / citryl-CoA lyase